ncbi:MAG: malto-oligosyltrehalose trehalohydrolase [Chloroflexota bacterium]|nr:malto-oligosyltrehalose trehalohydrolase [Chloroflexota bacterium]
MMQMHERLGATNLGEGRCHFCVWAPLAQRVDVVLDGCDAPMERDDRGYHRATVAGVAPGARYKFRLDGDKERPDPVSRYQPEGVHGPSAVTDPGAFRWSDAAWVGMPVERFVIYEMHIGTFTEEGTFDAVIPHLDTLKELGITAIEIMPVAQYPGDRGWGYDGVQLYAVQNSYGGPEGLMRLVDACHTRGIAAILDVVYNHFGPEGNYLWDYAPYFTERYTTPWGAAVNFDGPHSDEVRRFFLGNALQWLDDFHFDGLRLDAIDAIKDYSAYPFLSELADATHARAKEIGRPFTLIAESDLNDAKVIRPPEQNGYGLDAQWSDDFHHALHVLLTGERRGYYADFAQIDDLAQAYRESFVYAGKYSTHRKRRHGNRALPAEGWRFVVCSQNHDQVGNRATGDRLGHIIPYNAAKLAAAAVLLSPFVPLLFMGEEYGEPQPFQYFTSHGDAALIAAVREGRRAEFASFSWEGDVPDPDDPITFQRSKLTHREREDGPHGALWRFYQELLRLRRTRPALAMLDLAALDVHADEGSKTLTVRRWASDDQTLALFNFSDAEQKVKVMPSETPWHRLLDSADTQWRGPGSVIPGILPPGDGTTLTLPPWSVVLLGTDVPT